MQLLEDTRQLASPFIEAKGEDGVDYIVRPFLWSLERAELIHSKFLDFKILSDDIPRSLEGFLAYISMPGSLWFEVIQAIDEKGVGLLYLSDITRSWSDGSFLSATFHGVAWDAKAGYRRTVVKLFIQKIFSLLKLHRLQAAIPLNRGGAIRTLKKLGFKDEGVMREARRYNGVWFGVLLMSILDHEVSNG